MCRKNNIFDTVAKYCSYIMLISLLLSFILVICQSKLMKFTISGFLISLGSGCIFQNVADNVRLKLKNTLYLIHIPCTIIGYQENDPSTLSDRPILQPLDPQYYTFKGIDFLGLKEYPIGSNVEVCLTPDMNFDDHFIITPNNIHVGHGQLILGICATIIGIIVFIIL